MIATGSKTPTSCSGEEPPPSRFATSWRQPDTSCARGWLRRRWRPHIVPRDRERLRDADGLADRIVRGLAGIFRAIGHRWICPHDPKRRMQGESVWKMYRRPGRDIPKPRNPQRTHRKGTGCEKIIRKIDATTNRPRDCSPCPRPQSWVQERQSCRDRRKDHENRDRWNPEGPETQTAS